MSVVQIQRILVAVDYSAHSRQAFEYAVGLCRRFGAQLVLVHVWERPAYLPDGLVVGPPGEKQRTLVELVRENAEREMDEFLRECAACDELDLRVVLEAGEPAAAILRVSEQHECDLVVMGARGHTGVLFQLLLGSVTAKVVRLSSVPVVAVPDPPSRLTPMSDESPRGLGRG